MSDANTQSPAPGLFARAVGMIFSPIDTFKRVVETPKTVGILFLVCLAIGLAAGLPQFTESGKSAMIDMQITQIERTTGRAVAPEQYAQLERFASFGPYLTMVGTFINIPLFTIAFSALYWALFNIAFGSHATFGQVIGINAHSQVITALGAIVAAPVQWVQGSFSPAGPFNLGAVVPMLDPGSGLALFLSQVTFFGLWQAIVCGVGLGVLYKRASIGIALSVLIIHLATVALFTVGLSSLMGGLSAGHGR